MDKAPQTDFGYQQVGIGEKTRLVGKVFDSVADRYDLMNDLMSLGIHRLWKRHFVHLCSVRAGDRVLDLAGGTGDIARHLARRVGPTGLVVLSDINAAMLGVGRARLIDRGIVQPVRCAQVNAESIPFADGTFDCVTIAFGLRNVTHRERALREMYRVLKPGGRLCILEFAQVRAPLLKTAYDLYSFQILPRLGAVVAGDEASYRYLAESIRRFPDRETLGGMLAECGFARVRCEDFSGGMVAMHTGYRT